MSNGKKTSNKNEPVVRFHPHALVRMRERGATAEEVKATVAKGKRSPAKFGRTSFKRNFSFRALWRGKHYLSKQVEAFAAREKGYWLVISVITRYF